MYISTFEKGMCKARSKFYDGGAREVQTIEIERNKGVGEQLSYGRGTLQKGIKCCKAMRESKIIKLIFKAKLSFPGLSASNGLRVNIRLSALNLHIAGAKHERISTVDVEIWPQFPNVRSDK